MLHFDYNWDLHENGIILDEELDVDKLGWKGGDYFKLVNVNGRCHLVRMDPLVKFIKEGERHVQREQVAKVVGQSTAEHTDLSKESANLAR